MEPFQTEPQTGKRKRGCLGCISLVLNLIAGVALLILAVLWPAIFIPVLVAFVILFIILMIRKKRKTLNIISGILLSVILTFSFIMLVWIAISGLDFSSSLQDDDVVFYDPNCETSSYRADAYTYTIINGNTIDSQLVRRDNYVKHARSWEDTRGKTYSGQFRVSESSYNKASRNRADIYLEQGYWGDVYLELVLHDYHYLRPVIDMYDSIGKAKRLNQNEFANMVVSSVQSIPYCYIASAPCDHPDVVELCEEMQSPCYGNIIHYGVHSPIEFLYTQLGDCDTRAVFLYIILSHFGYDVAVLVSEHYSHAVLAINTRASGIHLMRNGKKYYLWETTAEGFSPGEMPTGMGNTNFWEFALMNKP